MSWRMIGKPYETAEMSGTPTITQKFVCTTNQILKGINAGIIFYNDPTFTNIALRLYSDQGGSAKSLIATSSTIYTKAQCMAGDTNSYRIMGFTFGGIHLRAGMTYHLALYATGYTGDSSAHIAWRSSYPDPQYRTGLTLNAAKAAKHHFEFGIISDAL